MLEQNCHYIRVPSRKKNEPDEWLFIPGCMGAAASGPHACTCMTTDQKVDAMERRYANIDARLRWMEAWVEKQFGENAGTLMLEEWKRKQTEEMGAAWVKRAEQLVKDNED